MASAAIAGLMRRLVQRLDVRYEPIAPSPAAASTAAAGPWTSSSRKMNTSPAANEFFERGMRTGKMPASMAMAMPMAICSQAVVLSAATFTSETTSTAPPSSAIVHQ